MDEKVINLGGNRTKPIDNTEVINKNITQSTNNTTTNSEIPQEFIDTEFAVPTEEVELPSGGKFYPNGQKTVRIKYLTASEESILLSPELIRSGKVLDVLLETSIVDDTLYPENMITGDRNTVLIKLRQTGYGNDYPVKMTCPKCNEEFETNVDLSTLKLKTLEIEPDYNNEFDVNLPKTKWKVKFRLLTGKDEAYLNKASERTKKTKKNSQYSSLLTERYLLQIMEINGNRDKTHIKKAVEALPIADSLFFRSYVSEIEPGINLEHEFECNACHEVFIEDTVIGARLFWPNAKV